MSRIERIEGHHHKCGADPRKEMIYCEEHRILYPSCYNAKWDHETQVLSEGGECPKCEFEIQQKRG